MLNGRVKKLENKCIKEQIICIVMLGESKKDALRRAMLEISSLNDIFFIKIVSV